MIRPVVVNLKVKIKKSKNGQSLSSHNPEQNSRQVKATRVTAETQRAQRNAEK
jgi:hypothetical protein